MLYNLRAEMARNGMSQADLAEAIGTSLGTINNWICCRTSPPFNFALMIKEAIGTDEPLEKLFESRE